MVDCDSHPHSNSKSAMRNLHWGHISIFDNWSATRDNQAMARPLRIEIPGGRYHLTARGNERRSIFRDNPDREHFLELLAELPERFGTMLHAYVLMPNHFHLVLETPEANLSRSGQWLNVSYSVWFNRRHQRSGHLFQGRFAAILIEDDAGLQEVGRYVHLNPVRVKRLGLDRGRREAGKVGLVAAASAEVVAERLATLRTWKWSSYPAYAGQAVAPRWLYCEVLGSLCGGRSVKERQAALREYTEQAVREGLPERPWDRLIGGIVLGTEAFAERLRATVRGNQREQPMLRRLGRGVSWEELVRALELVKGEPWGEFRDRHGDWGRDAALWLGRRIGRMTLRELGERAGGLDYNAAGAAVSRFERRLAKDRKLARLVGRLESELSKVEM
jgi:putative transposase